MIGLMIQMVLLSVAMAQQKFGENDLDGLWFHITSAGNPFLPSSVPCFTRGQAVVKRDDYKYTQGIGGHKVHTRPAVWNDARRTCEEEGGHLAIVNSIAEEKVIIDLLEHAEKFNVQTGHPDLFFVGFHDLFKEGEFVTVHGQSLAKAGYTRWLPGQPDDTSGNENCGSFRKGGGINDLTCTDKYGFICELPTY